MTHSTFAQGHPERAKASRRMRIIYSLEGMSKFSRKNRLLRKSIGLVATMGALHKGHLSLIRKARQANDLVAVSIFINPAQFGPEEDFKKYPRDFRQDAVLCKKEGVDVIFYPDANQMYPGQYKTFVYVSQLSGVLCGKSRPGHFRGVATVVLKLFNIIQPSVAYFGQKDAQQVIIIKKMARDLNLPVLIKVMPTVREKDGLAMSSRNEYLSSNERKDAAVLFQALKLALALIKKGARSPNDIIRRMREIILKKKTARIDYISIRYLDSLNLVSTLAEKCLIALAVRIGKTRLIDNAVINLKNKWPKS